MKTVTLRTAIVAGPSYEWTEHDGNALDELVAQLRTKDRVIGHVVMPDDESSTRFDCSVEVWARLNKIDVRRVGYDPEKKPDLGKMARDRAELTRRSMLYLVDVLIALPGADAAIEDARDIGIPIFKMRPKQ